MQLPSWATEPKGQALGRVIALAAIAAGTVLAGCVETVDDGDDGEVGAAQRKPVQVFQVGYFWGEYGSRGYPHLNVEFLFWDGSEWSDKSRLIRTDAVIDMEVSVMCCGDYMGRDDWIPADAAPTRAVLQASGPHWHRDAEFGDSYYHRFDTPRVRCDHSYQVEATAVLSDDRTMSDTGAEWIKVTDCD